MDEAVIAALYRRLDQATAAGLKLEAQLRRSMRLNRRLLEGYEVALESLPEHAPVLRGALAGVDEEARLLLGE